MNAPLAPGWVTKARLPWSEGTVRYVPLAAGSSVACRRALAFLETRGWTVHRSGQAFLAHGPNGARWIGGWMVPGHRPIWWDRLLAGTAAGVPASSGDSPAVAALDPVVCRLAPVDAPVAPGPVPADAPFRGGRIRAQSDGRPATASGSSVREPVEIP
jgi:hypothetical protein